MQNKTKKIRKNKVIPIKWINLRSRRLQKRSERRTIKSKKSNHGPRNSKRERVPKWFRKTRTGMEAVVLS